MTRPRLLAIASQDLFLRPFRPKLEEHFEVQWLILPELEMPHSLGSFIALPITILIRRLKVLFGILKAKAVLVEWANDNLTLAAKLVGRRALVCRLHRYEIFQLPRSTDWNRVSTMVVVNQRLGHQLLEQVPALEGKIKVIHNYLNLAAWRAPESKPLSYKLGIVGAVSPRKGIIPTLRAFREAMKVDSRLQLQIIGKQKDREYVTTTRDLMERLDLTDNVTLSGYVKDLEAAYQEMDIILSFSDHESTHYTLFEGLACGAYPLSFAWDGVEEFLPTDNLFYTEAECVKKIWDFYKLSPGKRQQKISKLQETWLVKFSEPDPRNELVKVLLESV